MRFLLTTLPGTSHLLPLVPFAQAALAAGHEVRVACTGPALPAAVAAGLHALAVDDGASARPYEEIVRRIGETDMTETMSPAQMHAEFAAAFGETGNLMLGGLVEAVREWQADAVVYTPMAVAGLVAARATGTTAIVHGLGTRWPTYGPALAHLRSAATDLGVTEAVEADIEIDVSPPSLEAIHHRTTPAPTQTYASRIEGMRYLPYNGGGELPAWVRAPRTGRRRVAVTLGSLTATYGDGTLLRHIIKGAAELDVEIILMTGDAALPGPLPEYVRPVPWLPLRAVLESCAAVVHHGGAGSMYAALDAGVPQLVLPDRGTDSDTNAQIAVTRGVALRLDAGEIGASTIEQSLGKLLDSESHRDACTDVAQEMHDMPAPSTVIDRIAAAITAPKAGAR
ncbi:nucleotide disphospho-sugar-binding domain-containing protein [Nocardia brasiliensis]|uniref:nucleotide disphospho-sugar-binding domain-containing protein n=1 Tax=Nocardia brasiliensis TaxID=37326 RepID=UPI002456ABBE|nr:nucleotide disphospho-sugar-binding domain-containing protein [Nocardia brasiliensis]